MIKILFSSLLLRIICTARFTIPINQPSIPHSCTLTLQSVKFDPSLVVNRNNMAQAFLHANDEKGSKTLKVTVNNTRNEFYGELHVGIDSKFRALFQTARDETWLPELTCFGCPLNPGYYCGMSPTCDVAYERDAIDYPEEIRVRGWPGHEFIGLSPEFKVKSQVFFANDINGKNDSRINWSGKFDGFMGLGSSQDGDGFIDQAYRENYIQDKVFSFSFDRNMDRMGENTTNSSYITIGYIPEDKVNQLKWVSINSDSKYSWAMPVLSTQVGDKVINITSDSYAQEVSIDSGTNGLLLSPIIIQELKSQLAKFESKGVNGTNGTFYVCNDNHIEEFPNITLKVGSMNLVLNVFTYLDVVSTVSGDDGKHYCPLAVRESKIGAQILGNTFLMNNFVAFSKANQTVGILQEYRPISFGSYETLFQKFLPYGIGVGVILVIVAIVVVKKKKAIDNLKKELDESSSSDDVYSSKIGIN